MHCPLATAPCPVLLLTSSHSRCAAPRVPGENCHHQENIDELASRIGLFNYGGITKVLAPISNQLPFYRWFAWGLTTDTAMDSWSCFRCYRLHGNHVARVSFAVGQRIPEYALSVACAAINPGHPMSYASAFERSTHALEGKVDGRLPSWKDPTELPAQ